MGTRRGRTVMVGLACLGNPYGLRGALLPLELLPKITAWGAQYKSYIIEFGDLQEFVRKQGVAATSGLYLRADCFLLWVVPLSFIIPAIWRTGRADISSPVWTKGCIGGFGLTVSLVLASVLGFPGPGTPDWLVRLGRWAPLGLIALGVLSAVVLVRSSRRTALLAVMAGVTLAIWVLWLRVHLFGLEPGPAAWFGGNGPVRSGMGHRADWWCDGACSSLRGWTILHHGSGGHVQLSRAPGDPQYHSLWASGRFVITWNLGQWTATLAVETRVQSTGP